ncbi:T9SS type A sorting domain-containing protein [Hymenobacter metallilatus]|uniref:T9SS C-terminal target domain-containing protein n=1 Tax=Hymenobacter metallilatus TaxID=2493666 RepID=A0A3R9NGF7_9BACT|nr:T9SS type A sorting domain-containing protein [Hymenobacter metallilatus]RSK34025.1 T9SS C-terminal target domain-containing protein [Hymenobacter metallilatus]
MKKLLLACLLLSAETVLAQLPTSSFAVSSPCPASARNPSQLYQIAQDGSMQPIGTVQSSANSNRLIINALGYNQADQSVLYGMRVEQQSLANFTTFVPQLYRINLSTAVADSVGPMTPPPTPPASELTPTTGSQTATDVRQTLNFVADSGPDGTYYVGGATFRVIFSTFFGIPLPATAQVTDVRLYVGTVNLTAVAAPAWLRLNTTDPATAAVVESFRSQTEAYIRSNGSGPTPEGGIQDWVFDKETGNLVSYLGLTDEYLTVSNPRTAPVAVTTPVATPLPPTTSTDKNIGSMFSDRFYNVYAVRAATGEIFRIDNQTGNYTGRSYGAALGCTRGDAVSFRDALPLPVKLVQFRARATAEGVRLSWTTASEQQVNYFAVERSTDGTSWAPVQRVKAGNRPNGQQYAILDAAPLPGISYYRLAMHDENGDVAYSAVLSVSRAGKLQVYPNPASTTIQVDLPLTEGGTTLELRDMQGRVVRQQRLDAGSSSAELRTAGLPGGMYLLRVSQGSTSTTARVVLMAP